jgi:branched-chain amino acid transport system permease protein
MSAVALWELLLTGLMRGGFYALMAVGLSLVFGVMNVPQFAHGEFYMIGAYAAFFAFARFGLPPLAAIAIGAAAGFLAGALVERTLLRALYRRSRGDWVLNSFLLTVGLSFVLSNGAQAIWGANYLGTSGYWSGSVQLGTTMAIALDRVASLGISLAAVGLFWLFLERTDMGRAIRAVAADETGAMLVGIDPGRVRSLAFALSTMLAALAGASLLSLNPANPAMGASALYKSWYVVILSGLGSAGGAIPGGVLIGVLETASYYFLGAGWQDAASLLALILILLLRPSGLFGGDVKGIWER